MSAFNKLCLAVGKIVVYFLTFLSCFYVADLVCNNCKQYVDRLLMWAWNNRILLVVASFCILFAIYGVVRVLSNTDKVNGGCYIEIPDDEVFRRYRQYNKKKEK